MTAPVLLLPGSVLPAGPAYQALLPLLGGDVEAVTKELELYAGPDVAPGWSLAAEADGVLREADERGWEAFHLVAYSGGASAALVLATRAPERLRSLALLEPPWAGRWGWSEAHRELWRRYDEMSALTDDEYVEAFRRIQVRPEAVLPPTPPGPPPPWMATRPAGTRALLQAFQTGPDLDRERLAAFDRPALYVLGGLSNPVQFQENADRLGTVLPDLEVEVFADRHHFDPPHRSEPERLAMLLRALWSRA